MKTKGYNKILKMKVSDVLQLLADISETVGETDSTVESESKHKGRPKSPCLINNERREEVKAMIKRLSDEFWSRDYGRYEVGGVIMSVNILAAFIGYCLVELAVMPEEYNAADFLTLLNSIPMKGTVTNTQLICQAKVVNTRISSGNDSYVGTSNIIMEVIRRDEYFRAEEK